MKFFRIFLKILSTVVIALVVVGLYDFFILPFLTRKPILTHSPPVIPSANSRLASELEGEYFGSVTCSQTPEPVRVTIYELRPTLKYRVMFHFKGFMQQRQQNMYGFGEIDLRNFSIFMAHRLMGEATISKQSDGSIKIEGNGFQLTKKR
ncbi:MAG: hypothetical protein RMJ44_12335 [Cytophagales bacterium]|nr:hypothetical protein [Bernardetiaceae bacterium]MDW8211862.1 hypothetical protein [Cytophagales bacterium]